MAHRTTSTQFVRSLATEMLHRVAPLAPLALVALCVTAAVHANGDDTFDLSRSVQAGGGGVSSGGDFTMMSTIGEVVAAPMEASDFQIVSGFLAADDIECDPSDLDGDGMISGGDLAIFLAAWGSTCTDGPGCTGDIDFSGAVDSEDLAILLSSWTF